MLTKDFEAKIQKEIEPELTIRTNPNHDDIAGVYWNEEYIGVAVPPVEIKEDHDPKYRDKVGAPYKHIAMAEEWITGKLAKYKKLMKDDPSLFVDPK